MSGAGRLALCVCVLGLVGATLSALTDNNVENAKTRVLITGATGYLGQFVVDVLSQRRGLEIHGTYMSRPKGCPRAIPCSPLDFTNATSMEAFLHTFIPDVVVNLAAISSIYECESRPKDAQAINSPVQFLHILGLLNPRARFIQLSTDQVYPGGDTSFSEDSPVGPVNTYGTTKLSFEKELAARWHNHVILRASQIYGPTAPRPCGKSSFVQFLADNIRCEGPKVELFGDEYRCPIFVDDVVSVIEVLVELQDRPAHRIFNLGGPHAVSRAEFGALVSLMKRCDPQDTITETERPDGKIKAPKDVSMLSKRAEALIGRPFVEVERILRSLLPEIDDHDAKTEL